MRSAATTNPTDSRYNLPMTYCVAWQHQGTAFLIADAAVTKRREPTSSHSTFGELHPFEKGFAVEESAIKLFRWPKLALTGAGDATTIRKLVWEIDKLLERGYPPWLALFAARPQPDANSQVHLEAVAATRMFGRVRLFRLTVQGEWELVPSDTTIHLGSPAIELKHLVHNVIGDAQKICTTTRAQLACVLATCQSLTVHHYLMAQGAGGAFSGLIVDRRGTHWQPDLGYLILDPENAVADESQPPQVQHGLHVSCAVRDDILFVSSSVRRGALAFISSTKQLNPAALLPRVTSAFALARDARDNRKYDFAAVISTRTSRVFVGEMVGRAETPYLKLEYGRTDENLALFVRMEKRVSNFLKADEQSPASHVLFLSDQAA